MPIRNSMVVIFMEKYVCPEKKMMISILSKRTKPNMKTRPKILNRIQEVSLFPTR